ncbi:hypothetical protein [Mycobacterium sp. IEC1808]|uniref:hypothetical protein n=1 Tax=Mycobacterium sp. IEC1808 TaxID=1743230 RepID=UPI001302DE1B|nr:hypothetical protein [Mycobacterium sp. IEC1808]
MKRRAAPRITLPSQLPLFPTIPTELVRDERQRIVAERLAELDNNVERRTDD